MVDAIGLKAENLVLWLEPGKENDRKIYLYYCDHLGTPLALLWDRQTGGLSWNRGVIRWKAICQNRCIIPSECRASTMMRKRDCTTTATVIMIRCWGGILRRIRLGWQVG